MNRFSITSPALLDLQETGEHVSRDSPERAERLMASFEAEFQRLADMPGTGHLREDLSTSGVRFWSLGSYLIAYLVRDDAVEVTRVLHAARDVAYSKILLK